ncbi:unnamed protein product, partial [Rangifer tarandus platyrhynchus]
PQPLGSSSQGTGLLPCLYGAAGVWARLLQCCLPAPLWSAAPNLAAWPPPAAEDGRFSASPGKGQLLL